MITYANALTAIAAWCQANPGQPHTISAPMLARLGLTPAGLAEWAAKQGLAVEQAEEAWMVRRINITTTNDQ